MNKPEIDKFLLPTYYPGALFRWLLEEGYLAKDLLSNTDISEANLLDSTALISFRQQSQLLVNAMQLSNDPHLGLSFGSQMTINSHGMIGFAAMSAATLEEAIEVIIRYFRARAPLFELDFYKDENAHIRISEALDYGQIRLFMFDSFFSSMVNSLSFITANTDLKLQAYVMHPEPISWQANAHRLNMKLTFSQSRNELIVPNQQLMQKLVTAEPVSAQSANEYCDLLLGTQATNLSLVGELNMLLESKKYSFLSLDEAAKHFFLSPRTFRRELAKQGHTYQQLLDDARRKLATELLLQTSLPLQEIALMAGFNDASNFGRAFKAWTGKAPNDFRKKRLTSHS